MVPRSLHADSLLGEAIICQSAEKKGKKYNFSAVCSSTVFQWVPLMFNMGGIEILEMGRGANGWRLPTPLSVESAGARTPIGYSGHEQSVL